MERPLTSLIREMQIPPTRNTMLPHQEGKGQDPQRCGDPGAPAHYWWDIKSSHCGNESPSGAAMSLLGKHPKELKSKDMPRFAAALFIITSSQRHTTKCPSTNQAINKSVMQIQ